MQKQIESKEELSNVMHECRALGCLNAAIMQSLQARLSVHVASEDLPEKKKRELLSIMHKMQKLEESLHKFRTELTMDLEQYCFFDHKD